MLLSHLISSHLHIHCYSRTRHDATENPILDLDTVCTCATSLDGFAVTELLVDEPEPAELYSSEGAMRVCIVNL
jgi:hypothetical protein